MITVELDENNTDELREWYKECQRTVDLFCKWVTEAGSTAQMTGLLTGTALPDAYTKLHGNVAMFYDTKCAGHHDHV